MYCLISPFVYSFKHLSQLDPLRLNYLYLFHKQCKLTFTTSEFINKPILLLYKKIIFSLLLTAVSAFALDINTASAEEFVEVKGIGEKKAERIIAYRDEHGNFSSIDELKNVKGIGEKIVGIIKSES